MFWLPSNNLSLALLSICSLLSAIGKAVHQYYKHSITQPIVGMWQVNPYSHVPVWRPWRRSSRAMLKGSYLFQGQAHGNPVFYLDHLSLLKLFRPPTERFHKFSTSEIMFSNFKPIRENLLCLFSSSLALRWQTIHVYAWTSACWNTPQLW